MKKLRVCIIAVLIFCILPFNAFAKMSNEDIKIIWDSIDQRRANVAQVMVDKPFPSPKIGETNYGIGMIDYAFGALYQNTDLDTVNEFLLHVCENFNALVEHTGDFQTYFQMSMMQRIYYTYNQNSLYNPGRITPEAEKAIKEYFYAFLQYESKVEDAQKYDLPEYYLFGSGNHHVIRRVNLYLGAQMLKDDPLYKDEKLTDGHTVSEHFEAWQTYWKHDLVQRGKTALEIEYDSNGYYKYTMDVFMTLRDFAESSIVRDLAQRYLDVIWADIAVQTNNGHYGAARGRSTRESEGNVPIDIYNFAAWFNVQSSWRIPKAVDPFTGEPMQKLSDSLAEDVSRHPNQCANVLSQYLPPQVIADLVINYKDRGTFEYESIPPGRGRNAGNGWYTFQFPSNYKRYSYVTPDYIVGSLTFNRAMSYNDVMNQNRHVTVTFTRNGKEGPLFSRVYAETQRDYSRGFSDINSVAHKNAMIVQGLPEAKYYVAAKHYDLMIAVSKDIYGTITQENGWFFGYVPDGNGYVAFKPSKGELVEWIQSDKAANVMYACFSEKNVPYIIQAGSKEEYGSFAKFKAEIKKTKTRWNSQSEFEYIGPKDVGSIKWYTDTTIPKINNKTVDLEPDYMIKSPYVNGIWGTGEYEIKNTNDEKYYINFEYDEEDEVGFTKMNPSDFIVDWNSVKLKVNGSYVSTIVPPIIEDGTTLVPIRDLFESLGIVVNWDGATQKISSEVNGKELVMQIDNKNATVNGETKEMLVSPKIINDKTMVPARFIAEEFGAKVKWDDKNQTVVIWKGL